MLLGHSIAFTFFSIYLSKILQIKVLPLAWIIKESKTGIQSIAAPNFDYGVHPWFWIRKQYFDVSVHE